MKKLILLFAATLISQYSLAGGEVGNETITKDGKPTSTSITPCAERIAFNSFHQTMLQKPLYADYFKMIQQIFAPFEAKLHLVANNPVVCITDGTIENFMTHLPPADGPRVALWLSQGAGTKNLILIARRYFYANTMNDGERAATIVRELLHPMFHLAHQDKKDLQTDFMKHDLNHEIYKTFIHAQPQTRYSDIFEMINQYGLNENLPRISEMCLKFTTEQCLLTINAFQREKLLMPTFLNLLVNEVNSNLAAVSIETANALISLAKKPIDLDGKHKIKNWILFAIQNVETLEDLSALENMLSKNDLLNDTEFRNHLAIAAAKMSLSHLEYNSDNSPKVIFAEVLMQKSISLANARPDISFAEIYSKNACARLSRQVHFLKKFEYSDDEIFKNINGNFIGNLIDNDSLENIIAFMNAFPASKKFIKGAAYSYEASLEYSFKDWRDSNTYYQVKKEKIKAIKKVK